MTYAMMKQTRNWMPPVRQKRSQNALVLYALGDEVLAMVDALMRISSRTEGEFGSSAALVAGQCGMTMGVMCSNVRASRSGWCNARDGSRQPPDQHRHTSASECHRVADGRVYGLCLMGNVASDGFPYGAMRCLLYL